MKIIQIAFDMSGNITYGIGDDGRVYKKEPIRERIPYQQNEHLIGWEWKNANVKYPDSQPVSDAGRELVMVSRDDVSVILRLFESHSCCDVVANAFDRLRAAVGGK